MSCYFTISVSLEPGEDRIDYDDYVKLVRPIVEKHGGRYVVRSEGIEYMEKDWCPDRFIMIWFPDGENIDRCSPSGEYRGTMSKRENIANNQVVITTADEVCGDDKDKREGKIG